MSLRVQRQVYRQYKTLGLTRAEMLVLARIADKIPNKDTATFVGIQTLCQETDYCRRWIIITLQRLEQKGLLVIFSRKGGRGNKTYYEIPLNQFGDIEPRYHAGVQPTRTIEEEDIEEQEQEETRAEIEKKPRTIEEELRFCRAIANRNNVSTERKAYWQARIRELEQQQQQQANEPPSEEKKQEQIAIWQEQLRSRLDARNGFAEGSQDWQQWNCQVQEAQDGLNEWKLYMPPIGMEEYITA